VFRCFPAAKLSTRQSCAHAQCFSFACCHYTLLRPYCVVLRFAHFFAHFTVVIFFNSSTILIFSSIIVCANKFVSYFSSTSQVSSLILLLNYILYKLENKYSAAFFVMILKFTVQYRHTCTLLSKFFLANAGICNCQLHIACQAEIVVKEN